MSNDLKIKVSAFMMDCKDQLALAKFYADLLAWEIVFSDEEYAVVAPPKTPRGAYPAISFQRNPEYEPPVWPAKAETQQQMAHIDFVVNDLEKAVQHAINCGAVIADTQFSDIWRVMLDPAGHPFCLVKMQSYHE